MKTEVTLTTEHLERFKRLHEQTEGLFRLTGRKLLLEPIKQPEVKTASGIVIASDPKQVRGATSNDFAKMAIVLLVGEDSSLEVADYNIKQGDIVQMAPYGGVPLTSFMGVFTAGEGTLELNSVDNVQAVCIGIDAYKKVIKALG